MYLDLKKHVHTGNFIDKYYGKIAIYMYWDRIRPSWRMKEYSAHFSLGAFFVQEYCVNAMDWIGTLREATIHLEQRRDVITYDEEKTERQKTI